MCYDSGTDALLTYGGFKSAGDSFSDMWIYSLRTQKWKTVISASYTVPCNSYSADLVRNGCFVDGPNRKLYMFGGGTSIGNSNEMWAFDIDEYTVTLTQWTKVAQTGAVPPPIAGFAFTSYVVSGKLKFVICKGLSLVQQTNDVFM
jgi:hypothetical protein